MGLNINYTYRIVTRPMADQSNLFRSIHTFEFRGKTDPQSRRTTLIFRETLNFSLAVPVIIADGSASARMEKVTVGTGYTPTKLVTFSLGSDRLKRGAAVVQKKL